MALQIEHEVLGSSLAVVSLRGKLMLGQACVELESLVPGLISSGARHLVFDLTGLTHIDSTGIGRFIDTYRRLAGTGGKVRLVGVAGAVRESFRVTRLDTVFPIYASVDAAREGLS